MCIASAKRAGCAQLEELGALWWYLYNVSGPRFVDKRVEKLLHGHEVLPTRHDIQRQQRWFRDDEIRTSFCRHPKAPFENVRTVMPTLSVAGLRKIMGGGTVVKRVRDLAKEILRRKGTQI